MTAPLPWDERMDYKTQGRHSFDCAPDEEEPVREIPWCSKCGAWTRVSCQCGPILPDD